MLMQTELTVIAGDQESYNMSATKIKESLQRKILSETLMEQIILSEVRQAGRSLYVLHELVRLFWIIT